MAKTVNSIAIYDQHLIWLSAETDDKNAFHITRVVDEPLPFVINLSNIQKSTSILEFANFLTATMKKHNLSNENTHIVLPGRYGLIKKVLLDQYVPEETKKEYIDNELAIILTDSPDSYLTYHPRYSREKNFLEEKLTVSVKKELFGFIRDSSKSADIQIADITFNTFLIDNFFRKLYPNILGEILLVSFTDIGLDMTVSTQRNYVNYHFRPYTASLQKIEEFALKDIVGVFTKNVDEIQHPTNAEMPLYSFTQIFLYGPRLTPKIADAIKSQYLIPSRVIDASAGSEIQLLFEDRQWSDNFYRYLDAFSAFLS